MRSALLAPLCAFVDTRVAQGHRVYPPAPLAALASGGPAARVVILGQDPYHGPGQAHGYAFSVPSGLRPPPSLANIFRELVGEALAPPPDGSLLGWAQQGVLLLNTVLTVEQGLAGSHAGRGWEAYTDAVIDALVADPTPKVFLLWGAQAQAKRERLGRTAGPALRLMANHPSPLSARRPPRPFLGCGHFRQANSFLLAQGLKPVDWGAPARTTGAQARAAG